MMVVCTCRAANLLVHTICNTFASDLFNDAHRATKCLSRPFGFVWNSLKGGLLVIIPSGTALKLAGEQVKSSKAR
jgi:hypothetical protein